jgi:alkylation response protein AidB-like acyl-CoA dehydrogenase
MDFTLNEEQRMLVATVQRFAADEYDFEARGRRLHEAGGGSPALWRQLAALGLFGLNVPVEHGGIGGGAVETLLVMEQLGRALVLEPFLATGVLAPRLIARHGTTAQRERFLPCIAEGSLRFALGALEPHARYDLADIQAAAEPCAGGFVLSGRKAVVLDGDSADWLIVPARTPRADGGVTLFLVDAGAEGVHREGFATLDDQRAAEIRFDRVIVDAAHVIGPVGAGFPLLEWTVDLALAALSAEAVGAMERLTELTCEHLRNRVQFGKPIGSFQSLQHRAADMRIALEQARALALMAAAHVDDDDRARRRRAASAAKAMAGRSGRTVGQQATQLHGGMGMTDEMACGHYFKRLTAIDMTLGNAAHHVEAYGEWL